MSPPRLPTPEVEAAIGAVEPCLEDHQEVVVRLKGVSMAAATETHKSDALDEGLEADSGYPSNEELQMPAGFTLDASASASNEDALKVETKEAETLLRPKRRNHRASTAFVKAEVLARGEESEEEEDDPPAETVKAHASAEAKKMPKRNKYKRLSVLAAGHAKNGGAPMLVSPERDTILKPLQEVELDCYLRIWGMEESPSSSRTVDPICEFVAKYHGTQVDVDEAGVKQTYISLDNLLAPFDRSTKVMDVKLGIRTFCEDECTNQKLRPDMYKRLVEMYPWEATEEDHERQGITKHRFMQARDGNSTIGPLGFRIDGVGGYHNGEEKELEKWFAGFHSLEDTRASFLRFVQEACEHPLPVAEQMLTRLHAFRAALTVSPFFKENEFIGSSLLFIVDPNGVCMFYWIDFGKTQRLPDGVEVTHMLPWAMGNHEDGILKGVDNLILAWEGVAESCGLAAAS